MEIKLETALDNIEATYAQISEMASGIVNEVSANADSVIDGVKSKLDNLTNDGLREAMVRLSLEAYSLGAIKEKSAMKAEIAESLRKEAYAKSFSSKEGSVALKESSALLDISSEIVAETVCNLIASLLRNKLDELHRVVDTLKTTLTSRLSEARLVSGISGGAD